jgi:hypothetical protein
MMGRSIPSLAVDILLAILVSAAVSAQTQTTMPAAVITRIVPGIGAVSDPPDAPETPGAWSAVIVTRSGFGTGTERTLTSAGAVNCSAGAACRPTLSEQELTTVSALLVQTTTAFNTELPTICSDCPRTAMLIKERDANGQQRMRIAAWDVTTKSQVPVDVLQLFTSIASLIERAAAR